MKVVHLYCFLLVFPAGNFCIAQGVGDSNKVIHHYKNIIRYNLSSALFFGADSYIILGYERLVSSHQSFSINIGRAAFPKLVSIITDSFNQQGQKRGGFNLSVDYRFYLAKENKFEAPHGLYIGPYYSYNHYTGENQWTYKSNSNKNINSSTDFTIHTIGFQLGYQLLLWKRVALDMVLVGPGIGFYKYQATINSNIVMAEKEQIFDGLKQLLTQKIPGLNYVFSDKKFDGKGTMKTTDIGYRYIIHIGFYF